jgi:glycosyltransferase involved in cell wall biosynthesis
VRIAIVTAFPRNPAAPRGGVEAVSVNLVRALSRLPGLEAHVVTVERGIEQVELTSWSGVSIHRLPAGRGPLLAYAVGGGRRMLRGYLKRLAPDVVHAHDTYGIMVKGMGLPRVFTVHGFIHEDTRASGGRGAGLRALLWRWVELASWAEQPHIISISPFVRQRLQGIARGVIHDIENPIAEEFFDIARQESEGTIFCAAAIRRLKNTLGLVRAFERLRKDQPHARLRLAGPVSEPEYGREVEALIRERQLADSVALLGGLNSASVRQELSRASVFALVSLWENAPMCIAEALAAGVPVVASNRCGMPFMIQEGESGFLVDAEDPNHISESLGNLVRQPGLRQRMGGCARQFAVEHFHPVRVAEKTLNVYRCALGLPMGGVHVKSTTIPVEL